MCILENVLGLLRPAPTGHSNWDHVAGHLKSIGYFAIGLILNGLWFGACHSRPRLWIVAVNVEFVAGVVAHVGKGMTVARALEIIKVLVTTRMDRFANLVEPTDPEAFLLDEDSEEVTSYYASLGTGDEFGQDRTKNTGWQQNLTHGRFPSTEDLKKRPGLRAMTHREYDAWLKAQCFHSSSANLSQEGDRCVRSDAVTSPCLTPGSKIVGPDRGRYFLGKEQLRMQLMLKKMVEERVWLSLEDSKLKVLGGNAFNTHTGVAVSFAFTSSIATLLFGKH